MKENPIISIIMPVFDVEKYLPRAIESIIKQTYRDFEFLIVDDGSLDNGGSICDAYQAKDDRIKVFHKKNDGAANARNHVMDIAKGKYLYFMDSDDWAEENMLKDMLNLAESNQVQLVVTGYYIDTYYSENHHSTDEMKCSSKVYASQREFRKDAYRMFDRNLLYTPWNKLYSADFIREGNFRFKKTLWDDFVFNLELLYDIERVCVSSNMYYHFIRARATSESEKYSKELYEKREDEHRNLVKLYAHWGVADEKSIEFISRRYVERLIGCMVNITNKNNTLGFREKRQVIKGMALNEKVGPALKLAEPKSFMMNLMLLPVRLKCVDWLYLQSKIISVTKSTSKRVFSLLKARR
jgi:glycosyltransferase involved in cell wall biosynthesis